MASGIWFCATCGYEVRSRGGKCHNCKEPLLESPLEELGEGEAEDEVGYNLDEWDDASRGELISALIDGSFRHRFEGDELVVAADDEDEVDRLIANLTIPGAETGDPEDDVPGRVLTKLADASHRLEIDPTDMVADGDLAEAAAGLFAIEGVWGVDEDDWAAIGRVTRRLLGALGADEALEEEIFVSSSLLSRMLKDLEGRVRGFGDEPEVAEDEDADEGEDEDGEEEGDEDEGEGGEAAGSADGDGDGDGELASGAEDEMVYELDDWRPEERAQISLLLERGKIPYKWEGSDLVVTAAHDEAVEGILGDVDRSGSESSGDEDDESRYLQISNLFGAADRLVGDPEDEDKQNDLIELADMIQPWATPFAVNDDEWWKIRLRAHDLAESINLGASRMVIVDGATNLRDLLRQFV